MIKLYYLAKRARLDIFPALSFLDTRTTAPILQDYGKITSVLSYLAGTKEMCTILKPAADNTSAKTYIDAVYANHPGMKSHTGVVVTL